MHCYNKENHGFLQKTDESNAHSSVPIVSNRKKYNNILPLTAYAGDRAKSGSYITSREDLCREDLSGRTTRALTARVCQTVVEGWLFAQYEKVPLNRAITITIELLDLPERFEVFRSALFDYLQKWQRDRYGKPAYVWVVEDGGTLGLHLHVAVHTRDGASLSRDLQRWIKGRAGIRGNMPRGAFHSGAASFGWLPYLLKGADAAAVRLLQRKFRLTIEPKPQGIISGKRYGVSRSLSQKARQVRWFDGQAAIGIFRSGTQTNRNRRRRKERKKIFP